MPSKLSIELVAYNDSDFRLEIKSLFLDKRLSFSDKRSAFKFIKEFLDHFES